MTRSRLVPGFRKKREPWPPVACGCCGATAFHAVTTDKRDYRSCACAGCGHRVYQLLTRGPLMLRDQQSRLG